MKLTVFFVYILYQYNSTYYIVFERVGKKYKKLDFPLYAICFYDLFLANIIKIYSRVYNINFMYLQSR